MTRTCEAPMKFGCTTLACHLVASSGFSLFLFVLPVDSFDQSRAQKQKNENSSKIIQAFRFVDYKTIPFSESRFLTELRLQPTTGRTHSCVRFLSLERSAADLGRKFGTPFSSFSEALDGNSDGWYVADMAFSCFFMLFHAFLLVRLVLEIELQSLEETSGRFRFRA